MKKTIRLKSRKCGPDMAPMVAGRGAAREGDAGLAMIAAAAIEVTIFAGARWLLPYRTPGIVAPPMGLVAARDRARLCPAHESPPDVEPTWTRCSIDGPPRSGVPQRVWGPRQRLYPAPSLHAMGVLREFSVRTGARVWVVCDHERGDDPYDQWPRPRRTGYETVFAQGGDVGRVLWQRALRGSDSWRVLAAGLLSSLVSRLIDHL
ncbi:hypothetical protein [Nannocystis pusilla]|uniref:Uncharacterized protein n=1 Tax=Nannocystis pusilla TaxID=889268 RepID=A0ABS7TX92_9BACT|nr:hypothetical protein [Nannocystis pusilla]MBZ5712806.1 hypothetical protein [Nannocystis pusilla]